MSTASDLTPNEKIASHLSDRQTHPIAPTGQFNRMHMVGLAKVVLNDSRSRAFRIQLSRLDRKDGAYIAQGLDTLYPGESYQYLYGVKPLPDLPPRRTNPIYGDLDPSNGGFLQDNFVEIAWGVQSGQGPNRLLAHWPTEGGSIVVSGSYAEVWAAGAIEIDGTPPTPPGSIPMFQASIDLVDGVSPGDAGSELSLTDSKLVQEPQSGGEFQTARGDESDVFSGWTVEGGAFPGSLRGSAVQDVAPFAAWSATIRRIQVMATRPIITMFTQLTGAAVDVIDNGSVDTNGVVTASPGNVAILINTAAAPTFLDIETQINGISLIIRIQTPSANPAFVVASSPNSWTSALGLPFAPIVGADQGRAGADPRSSIASLREGAVFYVPDFARRVRVALVQAPGGLIRVPLAGDPQAQIVFYDDRGFAPYSWRQGLVMAGATVVGNDPPVFHPVPGNAVMMGVYGDPEITTNIARVHWRIAP